MTTNTTTRYSDLDLNEFHILIDGKLEKAKYELDYMKKQIAEQNENSSNKQGGDWSDDSSLHSEIELLTNMAGRQQKFVRNLENALIRIKNKTYGICTLTNELIDKKRLLLVPHATKSIAAKQGILKKRMNGTKPSNRMNKPKVLSKILKKIQSKSSPHKPKFAEDDLEWNYDNHPSKRVELLDIDLDDVKDEDIL